MDDIMNSMQSSRISAGWTPEEVLKEFEDCHEKMVKLEAQLRIEQQRYNMIKTILGLCLQDCHDILNENKPWQKKPDLPSDDIMQQDII